MMLRCTRPLHEVAPADPFTLTAGATTLATTASTAGLATGALATGAAGAGIGAAAAGFAPVAMATSAAGLGVASAIPAAASWLTLPAALSLAGTGLSALGSVRQAQAAGAAGRYNAEIARMNAILAEQAGAQQASLIYEDRRKRIASATNIGFGTGTDPLAGSPIEVLADLAGAARLDEETARWNARVRAGGIAAQGALDAFEGRAASRTAVGQAGATLLTGGVNAYRLGAFGTRPQAV
jgi:hypothetical protein